VTSPSPPILSETAQALCLLFILLIPCAAAGLALVNAGLGRSRNAAHSMLAALCVIAVAALVYFLVGFAWQGYLAQPAYALHFGGKTWNWIGAQRFLMRGVEFDGSPASLAALFGMFSVGLAAMIPLGSGADRWRLGASCASTALLAGWTYPLFAHWVWSGGWLAQLPQIGGQGLLDSGGAGAIQVVGGLTALAITWILGPRRGKYTPEGMPSALPGHNAVLVLLGCFLAWLGWLGLDGAGAILFTGVESTRAVLIAVNTTLAASSAALVVAGITRSRFGKTDASLCANGWVGGLVAGSAGCAVIRPAGAVLIGLVTGALVVYSVEWLELHLSVDDPAGAISVHALGGLWGLVAVGLLGRLTPGGAEGQWIAQLVGVATLLGFVLPLTYGLNWLLNRFYPQRVAPEGERQGLDLYELGAGAYPDFMSHNEDLWQR
jgi:ammonium transporter, Amt family